MTVVLTLCLGLLGLAALILLARATMGPTMLDRTVALDVMIAVIICAVGIEAALNEHTFTLPILLVLTLLGFVCSVSIARFTRGSDDIEAEKEHR
ncbi:monovalent cation/H+ antiporter complex subunit F [Nocardioides daejeonensis]|uniref:monovalent cation/H+ antiporter complex subunit F n=1 Tax=Nocardioides daejeonensis TaxID=1046556 RepID=UPI000D74A631|nr:monovalent cation/H+ antiporter complex subunit F [Nocardioides daejeonensis]